MSTLQAHPIPIRHLVLIQFNASATADSIATVLRLFANMPSSVPDILYFHTFPLIPHDAVPQGHMTRSGGFTHVLDLLFASAAALHVYEYHAAHDVLKVTLRPLVQNIIVIDAEMPGLDVDLFLQVQRAPLVHHLTLVRPKAGVQRADIDPTVHRWVALPAVVPTLVWANAAYSTKLESRVQCVV